MTDDSTAIANGWLGHNYWRLTRDSLSLYEGGAFHHGETQAVFDKHGFSGQAVHETDNVLPDSAGLERWPFRYATVGRRISCPSHLQGAT
jgi:hypothetical protein